MNGDSADVYIGQADGNGNLCNRSANVLDPPARNTLCEPRSVVVDSAGRLYVADYGNNRALRFNPPFATNMDAAQVFGQADSFITKTNAPAPAAGNFGNAEGVAVDHFDNLYVTDLRFSRVLRFNAPAAGGDTLPDFVFGQQDFNSGTGNQGGNPAANTLNHPETVCFDGHDNMYVADNQNNRLLLFFAPLTTPNMSASRVFGQGGDFATNDPNKGGLSASSLNVPVGVAIDPVSHDLFVADSSNSRILQFTDPINDQTGDRVFGQLGDFTTGGANKGSPAGQTSADGLSDVGGVAFDAAGNLYAGDRLNSRALRYNVAPPAEENPTVDEPGVDPGTTPAAGQPCGTCGGGAATMMPLMMVCLIVARRSRRQPQ
jgi:sugar lactone lactonase YvrE